MIAATAFGLAIGTAAVVGYRSIDDQWQAMEQEKSKIPETTQQTQLSIQQRESKLTERERIAIQKFCGS